MPKKKSKRLSKQKVTVAIDGDIQAVPVEILANPKGFIAESVVGIPEDAIIDDPPQPFSVEEHPEQAAEAARLTHHIRVHGKPNPSEHDKAITWLRQKGEEL